MVSSTIKGETNSTVNCLPSSTGNPSSVNDFHASSTINFILPSISRPSSSSNSLARDDSSANQSIVTSTVNENTVGRRKSTKNFIKLNGNRMNELISTPESNESSSSLIPSSSASSSQHHRSKQHPSLPTALPPPLNPLIKLAPKASSQLTISPSVYNFTGYHGQRLANSLNQSHHHHDNLRLNGLTYFNGNQTNHATNHVGSTSSSWSPNSSSPLYVSYQSKTGPYEFPGHFVSQSNLQVNLSPSSSTSSSTSSSPSSSPSSTDKMTKICVTPTTTIPRMNQEIDGGVGYCSLNGTGLPMIANGSSSSASSSSTTTTTRQSKPRRRVATMAQRRAANIRERRRMFHLNTAFDKLRKKVPTFAYEKRLSRIETLRLAVMYISFMSEVLRGSKDSSTRIPLHPSTGSFQNHQIDSSSWETSFSLSDTLTSCNRH